MPKLDFSSPPEFLEGEKADLPFLIGDEEAELSEQTEEGQLSVDVSQTKEEVIITATMAGTEPADISLHLHSDLLTIRGCRRSPAPAGAEYFYQECYWGGFSRTIVLPVEVKAEMAKAEYRHGVLTVILPKAQPDSQIPIVVVEE